MSLKTALSSLLDCFVSKTGFNSLFDSRLNSQKAVISNQAMPAGGEPVYISSSNGDQIAPSNGYYCFQVSGSISNGSNVQLNAEGFSSKSLAAAASQSVSIFLPVKKGQAMSNYQDGFSTATLIFVWTVGGGYLSSLVKRMGGGLCLLSHLLRHFSSSQAGKRSQVHNIKAILSKKTTNGGHHTLLQVTDMFVSGATTFFLFKSTISLGASVFDHNVIPQLVRCFRLKKARVLPQVLGGMKVPYLYTGSIVVSAQPNFCAGGAL